MILAQTVSSSLNATRFNVFKVRFNLDFPDPDMSQPRHHTVIFVETGPGRSGRIHHVVGDLVSGMSYESKPSDEPDLDEAFHNKEFIGTIAASKLEFLATVCASQEAPHRQKKFNVRTMKTEPVKPDGNFYEKDEPRIPLVKCTEWTEDRAIPALLQAQILEETERVELVEPPES